MSKERILLLEEEANAKWTQKALLEGEDFQVIAVDSIDQALRGLGEGEFGGLITEYRINQSSSLPVIREFKKAFPEAYVMMVSHMDVRETEYEESINTGVDDFFQKPISFNKLLLHLGKGLSRRRELLAKKELEEELKKLNSKAKSAERRAQSA